MNVKDLLEEIQEKMTEYPDFLEWEVYTEQLQAHDKKYKKKPSDKGGQGWEWTKCGEGWEYFKCVGFFTKFPKDKIFTINVNY